MYPVLDLSLDGAQFVSFQSIKVGQRLNVSLTVHNQFGVIKGPAAVVWTVQIPDEDAFRVGIQFTKLTDEDVAKLKLLRQEFWPKQQHILEVGIHRLKVPQSVAKKLVALITEGRRRRAEAHQAATLDAPPIGVVGPLTDAAKRVRLGASDDEIPALSQADSDDAPTDEDEAREPDEATPQVRVIEEEPPDDAPETEAGDLDDDDGELVEPGPEAEPEPEPVEPERPDEPKHAHKSKKRKAQAEAALVPVFLIGGERTIKLDEAGRPIDKPVEHLVLPKLGKACFACRLTDQSMTSQAGSSFRLGDIVVFTTKREAADGAFAFVATRQVCCFRQVRLGENDVTLNALNPEYVTFAIDRDDIVVMWPGVMRAHVI